MSLVGPRPESLNFFDCFHGIYRQVLNHRPGIFGPAQTMFRNEAVFYPPTANPEAVYREVLFPAKASLDLSYYPTRTLFKDVGWIIRGLLAIVVGLSHDPLSQPISMATTAYRQPEPKRRQPTPVRGQVANHTIDGGSRVI